MHKLQVIQATVDDIHRDLIRVDRTYRPNTKSGDVVNVSAGGRSAYFIARGFLSEQVGVIALDDAARTRLKLEVNKTYEFSIKSAGVVGSLVWAWKATDPVVRVAARLSVLSVALGFLGCLLAVVSFL